MGFIAFEEVASVKHIVPYKLVGIAVELVGSRLGRDLRQRAHRAAVFRGQDLSVHAKFLH